MHGEQACRQVLQVRKVLILFRLRTIGDCEIEEFTYVQFTEVS